jgi:hypothetical protein
LLTAVHAHPAVAVTLTVPVLAAVPIDRLVGLIEYVQFEFCVTVKVWPAMVIVPLRGGPVLAATE